MKRRWPNEMLAALGLVLAAGFPPAIASDVTTGTATQVGAPAPVPPVAGNGQVRLNGIGTIDGKVTDPAKCTCKISQVLSDPTNGELVTDASGAPPPWLGQTLYPTTGSRTTQIICKSDDSQKNGRSDPARPTVWMEFKNRKAQLLECSLKVDRAWIQATSWSSDGPLTTSFELNCDASAPVVGTCEFVEVTWGTTGPSGHPSNPRGNNIRTPFKP